MNLLTTERYKVILKLSLPHEAFGIGVPKTNGVSRIHAVFLCAKSQFIKMLGWVGQSQDWSDPFVPVRQSYPVRLHNWRYVVGLKTLQTEAIMPKHTQVIAKNNQITKSVSLNSIFSIVDSNKQLIAEDLSLEKAKSLSQLVTGTVIKFQKMEVSQ